VHIGIAYWLARMVARRVQVRAGGDSRVKPFTYHTQFAVPGGGTSSIDIFPPSGEVWVVKKVVVAFGAGDGTYAPWCQIHLVDANGRTYPEAVLPKTSGSKGRGAVSTAKAEGEYILDENVGIRVVVHNEIEWSWTQRVIIMGYKP